MNCMSSHTNTMLTDFAELIDISAAIRLTFPCVLIEIHELGE